MIEYIGDMPISKETKRILDAALSKEEHIPFVRWLREHVNIPDYATLLIDSEYCRGAIAGWKGASEHSRQDKDRETDVSEAYDTIDSFLRNSLADDDYALYSKALDDIFSGGGEPVGRIKTVGGYPDGSEHTVEWLVKHKDIQDGDLLYTSPQPAEPVGRKRDSCNCNQGQVCQVCDPTDESMEVQSDHEDYITEFLSEHADHNTEHGRMSFDKWTLRDAVRALLAHYGHPTTLEGWQLVPKVPTHEMIKALWDTITEKHETTDRGYAAMHRAAPKFGEEH